MLSISSQKLERMGATLTSSEDIQSLKSRRVKLEYTRMRSTVTHLTVDWCHNIQANEAKDCAHKTGHACE